MRHVAGIAAREVLGQDIGWVVRTAVDAESPWVPAGNRQLDAATLRSGVVLRWARTERPHWVRVVELDKAAAVLLSTPAPSERSAIGQAGSESAGEASMGRFEALLTETDDAVLVVNADGRIMRSNGAAEGVLGLDARGGVGARISELMRVERAGVALPMDDIVQRVSRSGRTARFLHQVTVWGMRGDAVEVHLHVVPFACEKRGALIILRDIAFSRRVQHEAVYLHRARSMTTAAAGISHDLNDCTTAGAAAIRRLAGAFESVRRGVAADSGETADRGALDSAEAALSDLAEGFDRILNLTGQFQRFFAMSATSVGTRPADVVHDAATLALRGSGVVARIEVDPDLPDTALSNDALGQIVFNIVRNAQETSEDGDEVFVSARSVERANGAVWVDFEVRDQGFGIAPHHLDRVWEPYFTTKERGTGMGLTVMAWLLNEVHGEYRIYSEPGFGTTVRFSTPVRATADVAGAVVRGLHEFDGRRVLVLEDEPLVSSSLCNMLVKLGCEVSCAHTGRDALRQFRSSSLEHTSFDVVIIDHTLPGERNGATALTHMRQIDPLVRAILTTGHSHLVEPDVYKRLGFHAVLPKPFDIELVREAMWQVLRGA